MAEFQNVYALAFQGASQLDVALPTGKEFFSTIKIMKLLTTVLTNNLGNYEKEYMNALDKDAQRVVQKYVALAIHKCIGVVDCVIYNYHIRSTTIFLKYSHSKRFYFRPFSEFRVHYR
jgi:hypothetical protein